MNRKDFEFLVEILQELPIPGAKRKVVNFFCRKLTEKYANFDPDKFYANCMKGQSE